MRMKAFIFLVCLSCGAHASFAAAPLPLNLGDYVIADQSCSDAPFAAMIHFDQRGFSGPHTSQCTSVILSQKGNSYRIRTTCAALGDGTQAPPSVTTENYVVESPTGFLRQTAAGKLAYKFCPRS